MWALKPVRKHLLRNHSGSSLEYQEDAPTTSGRRIWDGTVDLTGPSPGRKNVFHRSFLSGSCLDARFITSSFPSTIRKSIILYSRQAHLNSTSFISFTGLGQMNEKVNAVNGLSREQTHESTMERIRSAGILTISPEVFEKLYLQPQVPVRGELRNIVGNPTPL